MSALVTLEEAQRLVLEQVRARSAESVPIGEAFGRVVLGDARAETDLPPFASSAMDGFAVRSGDAPGTLPIAGQVAAGSPSAGALKPGTALAISTGGVVPEGADAVVPIEYVVQRDNSIEIPDSVAAGANVRPRGGDVRSGDVVVEAGTRLGAPQVGALAAAGIAAVECGRRPRVAVLATGSELAQPGAPLAAGQIYESNTVMLAAALASEGAEVDVLPSVADDEGAHRAALERGLAADVLVTSGGVSVGPHDLVRAVERDLGVEEVFWRVAIKPGKPVSFGVRGETLVFGLPGNPVSSLVGCELFVKPALRALQGMADPLPRFERGVLARAMRRTEERDELARARVLDDGALEPLGGQESHMIARTAGADALVHIPRGNGELPAGSAVRWLRI